jgi:hypothetical protein
MNNIRPTCMLCITETRKSTTSKYRIEVIIRIERAEVPAVSHCNSLNWNQWVKRWIFEDAAFSKNGLGELYTKNIFFSPVISVFQWLSQIHYQQEWLLRECRNTNAIRTADFFAEGSRCWQLYRQLGLPKLTKRRTSELQEQRKTETWHKTNRWG